MSQSRRPVMSADELRRFYQQQPWTETTFHNPYTFIPFPDEGQYPQRRKPTPLTIDEVETDRFTGVLELEVTTVTPLMSCDPTPVAGKDGEHRTYRALTIGEDVIVPATGVRGALRTLMTILVGGTLGYLDEELYLCQGRDASLGPRGKNGGADKPANVFLARVKGRPSREGGVTVELGETRQVKVTDLENLHGSRALNDLRPTSQVRARDVRFIDDPERPKRISERASNATPWQLKLSGRRVNSKGAQHEGAFRPRGEVITLDKQLYRDYLGRHRNTVRPELQEGDLVWLEPDHPDLQRIEDAGQVKSIQWARWGRRGTRLRDAVPSEFWPDYLQDDGKVDEVTDLFGLASPSKDSRVQTFAARVRPENLVFHDAARSVQRVTLAPLAPPKPGCLAFYRDQMDQDPAKVSRQDHVRGYKVYRVPVDGDEPWHYEEQPVFDTNAGRPDPNPRQKVNKTVDLLPKSMTGRLRITVRALSDRELALVLQACHVPWRLGGGKPLGLGACSVKLVRLLDEQGQAVPLPARWQDRVQDLQEGVHWWTQSQVPVERMRYPRAAERNNKKISRGGHVWFKRHASPKKADKNGAPVPGLESREIQGQRNDLPGQLLPPFLPDQPQADVLQGHDLLAETAEAARQRNRITAFKRFDPNRHATGSEQSGGNHSQSRQSREDQRARDRGPAQPSTASPVQAHAQGEPSTEAALRKGQTVPAVICADPNPKAGKTRCFARHEAGGREGVIQNAHEMPAELREIGRAVTLYVIICDNNQLQFKWQDPAKASRPDGHGPRGKGGPRGGPRR